MVRSAKREAEDINSRLLLVATQRGNMDLLGELKKFKNSKNWNVVTIEVVENADNPHDIVDKFRQVYDILYKSMP